MSQTILAFDMGIRNLAFCLVDVSGREFVIKAWDNYDLLAGTDSQAASRCGCGGPPSWSDESIWCKKCVKSGKASKKALPEGTTLTITSLKELALSEGWALGKKVKKEETVVHKKI